MDHTRNQQDSQPDQQLSMKGTDQKLKMKGYHMFDAPPDSLYTIHNLSIFAILGLSILGIIALIYTFLSRSIVCALSKRKKSSDTNKEDHYCCDCNTPMEVSLSFSHSDFVDGINREVPSCGIIEEAEFKVLEKKNHNDHYKEMSDHLANACQKGIDSIFKKDYLINRMITADTPQGIRLKGNNEIETITDHIYSDSDPEIVPAPASLFVKDNIIDKSIEFSGSSSVKFSQYSPAVVQRLKTKVTNSLLGDIESHILSEATNILNDRLEQVVIKSGKTTEEAIKEAIKKIEKNGKIADLIVIQRNQIDNIRQLDKFIENDPEEILSTNRLGTVSNIDVYISDHFYGYDILVFHTTDQEVGDIVEIIPPVSIPAHQPLTFRAGCVIFTELAIRIKDNGRFSGISSTAEKETEVSQDKVNDFEKMLNKRLLRELSK